MKHRILIIVCYILMALFVLGFASALFVPFAIWEMMPSTPMNVWVVDKTVPNMEYREHRGLFWTLNSLKIVNSKTGKPFDYANDYFGAVPVPDKPLAMRELPSTVEHPDLIYLADTYGVYEDDYFSENIEGSQSKLLYGGLQDEEMGALRANLFAGNTIVGEFNIASAPTNRENRDALGELFHLSWSGWSGRFFKDLTKSVEVPLWTIENYEKSTNKKWDYYGEGYVFVSDEDKVFVLTKGKDYGKNGLQFSFAEEYQKEFDSADSLPYEYWFEFTEADPSAEVLANYNFDLTEKGQKTFEECGLPQTFPAIIRSKSSQYTSYYYAGDFADAEINDKWSNYYGFAKFKKALPLSSKGDNNKFYWKCYVPLMTKIISDVKIQKEKTTVADGDIRYNAKTSGAAFFVKTEGEWQEFFAKGVNIGSSVPGKWFTEFSKDERLYSEWLEKIGEMHANSVRVYTLLPPQFYRAFVHYNETHPDAPLWLYQEMWPEEYPEGGDYLEPSYEKAYTDEIKNVIDAMHGQANIPERKGRAFGIYTADVSPYIAGYLVGRELEPEEVISTNEKNPDYVYLGKYIEGAVSASPCEAWLAMNCDYAVEYEMETYQWQHPVGIVSWPTLDPKEHDSEWNAAGKKELEYNDKVSVDINQIVTKSDLKTGFFGAYHIYPNYPDFMNNEQSYANYVDEQGSFRYGGYLQEFIAGHKKYPALVAEFGIATGMGNAHSNPDGYNHGGLTEKQQGEGIVRMFSAIKKEGYAGGLIFEWTDEWAKKTWTTEPYIVPFDRNPLWHNGVDPEQNYGILAMESAGPKSEPYEITGEGLIKNIKLTADETYLGIKIELKREVDFKVEDLIVGLDTYDRKSGDSKYAAAISQAAPSGLEFTLVLSDEKNARLLAHPGYNVTKGNYASYPSATGIFEPMSILINKERVTRSGQKISVLYEDQSVLRYGTLENNSHNHWRVEGKVITLRIPWTRINVSDPSSMRVLCDTRENPLMSGPLQTVVTEGIMLSAIAYESGTGQVLGNAGNGLQKPFGWQPWDIPDYKERLKDSYSIIREYFVQDR